MNLNKCECKPENSKKIKELMKSLPEIEDIYNLSDFFKIMGDSTRLKILITLIQGEFCVNELSYMLDMSQSAISHQLKTLRISKLVKARREGRSMYYSLDDEHIEDILNEALIHIRDC